MNHLRTQPPFGRALQRHRGRRGWSQLHLALLAGVSARHLSFLETGRAEPSREMVLRLAAHLGLSLRAQNQLLEAAGFAAAFPSESLDAPALDAVRTAARLVLDAHEPFPALVIDRTRTVLMHNAAAARLLGSVSPELLATPINVFRLLLHADGLAPRIDNFAEHARHLVERLRRDADAAADGSLDELLAEVCAWPHVRECLRTNAPPSELAVLPLRVRDGGGVLSFIVTSTTFGTPLDVTVAELAIESLLPADATTAAKLREMARLPPREVRAARRGALFGRMTDDHAFDARWFDTPDGRMHYVDVGPRSARPVLLVHGNPSSGYLFRRFIEPLTRAGLRVIVPDHLGFGRSDKPTAAQALSPEAHAARLDALVHALDLRDVSVVGHDWGVAFALDALTREPQRVRSVAVFNGFAHAPDGSLPLPLPLRLFRVPLVGALLVHGLNLIVRAFLLGGGLAHPERLPADARATYLGAHPRWRDRAAMLALARAFPATADEPQARWLAELETRLSTLAHVPVWVVWGMRDTTLPPAWVARWTATCPHATVTRLEDAGHFVQEDAHGELVPAVTAWAATEKVSTS